MGVAGSRRRPAPESRVFTQVAHRDLIVAFATAVEDEGHESDAQRQRGDDAERHGDITRG